MDQSMVDPGPASIDELPTTLKRKETSDGLNAEDRMRIIPLGAGNEVGRSCLFLTYKGKNVLFDCGIHPAFSGDLALPFFDEIDPSCVDILLVTHFHLDHSASLPYFLEQTSFKGRVFMTHATKMVYRLLVGDYVKISKGAEDDLLYTEKEVEKSMDRIEVIDFHQILEVNGIRFWCYTAGHVLGAAMFVVDIAGVRVLYTGDYSREEDRHLQAAEMPPFSPEVCIIESTYGIQLHQAREDRERMFTGVISQTVLNGGRVLIPAFALGRAQELLLILEDFWESNRELHGIPIFYASPLARRCMEVYQTYISSMNDRIKLQYEQSNPFEFRHIHFLGSMKEFDDSTPCVVMASPGGLQSGLSRQLFDRWCQDKRSACVIPGYVVDGTLAKEVLKEPDTVTLANGLVVPLNMSVHYISFSAHADYAQTHKFLADLQPGNVILVHGEAREMGRLKDKLETEFAAEGWPVFTPRNTAMVDLYFKRDKVAKAVGRIAEGVPSNGSLLSGLLVKKGFNYQLLDPQDLSVYTQLATGTLVQRQLVHYVGSFRMLGLKLKQMYDNVTYDGLSDPMTVQVHDLLTVIRESGDSLVIQWVSDPMTDMVADSVVAIVLQLGGHNGRQLLEEDDGDTVDSAGAVGSREAPTREQIVKVKELLEVMFGAVSEDGSGASCLRVEVDGCVATVDVAKGSVSCEDDCVRERIEQCVGRLLLAMFPLDLRRGLQKNHLMKITSETLGSGGKKLLIKSELM